MKMKVGSSNNNNNKKMNKILIMKTKNYKNKDNIKINIYLNRMNRFIQLFNYKTLQANNKMVNKFNKTGNINNNNYKKKNNYKTANKNKNKIKIKNN